MNLEKIRKEIDLIDKELLDLFKRRFILAHEIGLIKKKNKLKIEDSKREKEILSNNIKEGILKKLNQDFIKKIFLLIFEESKSIQRKL